MEHFCVGARVEILAMTPEFYRRRGTITAVTEPLVADERSRQEAFRELRLYNVRLDDGRKFRFRGKELRQHAE